MANEIQFPTSPTNGNIYSMGGRNYRYDSAQDKFVAVATATIVEGGGVTIYATIDDLPLSGNTQGDLAHVTANNTLYFWNGSGWYKIALINNSPSISNVNSSYTLSDIGADTVITIVAEDPEGLAITYSIASDTSGNTATVVQGTGANTNIFTITPSTDANDNGTFSLTFRASDGVNIATAPASFTLNISTTVENSNYTTALITSVGTNNQVNNDFVDSSTNSHTVTAAGNATQSTFSPYRHGGYSTYFDGSGDYLTGPSIVLSNSTAFTIEMWYYNTSSGTGEEALICQRNVNSPFNGWRIYNNSGATNQLRFYNGTAWVTIASNLAKNQWHHIAVVSQGSGTDQGQCYLNGVAAGSAFTTSSSINHSANLTIGTDNAVTTRTMTGYLADVRVVNGTAVYTSAFTPPTERLTTITNTSLLTCHLPYIADGSTNSHAITVNGNTKTEPFSPYDYETYSATDNGGSMYFDGNGDYVKVTNTTTSVSGDFTIECWLNFNSYRTSGANSRVFCMKPGGNTADNLQLIVDMGTPGIAGSVSIWTNAYTAQASTPIDDDSWHHIAVTRESGTVKIYIDGTLEGSGSNSTTFDFSGHKIGTRDETADTSSKFIGSISDFRTVVGTAVYTSNFTPPTAPLTDITNTLALVRGTNAGIIDKSQTVKALTLNGDAKSSTTQSKYLSSSMYFDGNDYILMPDIELGSSDYTVECWAWISAQGGTAGIFSKGSPGGLSNITWSLEFSSSNNYVALYIYAANSGAYIITGSTNIITSSWNHIAVTRSGNETKLFVNGTQDGSTYTGNYTVADGGDFYLGGGFYAPTTRTITGYMSDFRVTKGLARYTANFTPPTAALEG